MIRRKFLALSAAIAATVAMLGIASPAKADFVVRYSVDNGGTWTILPVSIGVNPQVGGPGTVSYLNVAGSITGTGLSIIATAFANSSGVFTEIDLGVTGNVSGNRTGANAILIQATINNIATVAPALASYSMSNTTGNPTVVQQSWAGGNNVNPLVNGSGASFAGSATSGPFTLAPGQGTMGSFLVPGTANPYAATVQTTLNQNYGPNGTGLSLDNHLQITPVPAPAGLVLALSGVPVAGLAWLRRRKVVA